jgi:hypothetical protein
MCQISVEELVANPKLSGPSCGRFVCNNCFEPLDNHFRQNKLHITNRDEPNNRDTVVRDEIQSLARLVSAQNNMILKIHSQQEDNKALIKHLIKVVGVIIETS